MSGATRAGHECNCAAPPFMVPVVRLLRCWRLIPELPRRRSRASVEKKIFLRRVRHRSRCDHRTSVDHEIDNRCVLGMERSDKSESELLRHPFSGGFLATGFAPFGARRPSSIRAGPPIDRFLLPSRNRPVAAAPSATPRQEHGVALDRRLERNRAARAAESALVRNPEPDRNVCQTPA
jgi:hypothetical protein